MLFAGIRTDTPGHAGARRANRRAWMAGPFGAVRIETTGR